MASLLLTLRTRCWKFFPAGQPPKTGQSGQEFECGAGSARGRNTSTTSRRPEIGLRRALGATRGDVRRQFLAESLLLSGAGGLGGVAIGAAITAAYASGRSWGVAVPLPALAGALGAALLIGAVAGLYPALRAAGLAPTDALRT